jgi:O-antigen biosynthesis protein
MTVASTTMRHISIGIHTHEQPEQLHATLDSVRRNTASGVELVLLPDGPDPAMKRALQAIDGLPQLGTEEPLGPAACFNRLATSSAADVVVLLESGSRVGPGWLDHLLAALTSDPRNGLAGPTTNYAWNEQCIYWGHGDSPAEIARTAQVAALRFGREVRTLEPLYSLADFCYVVRREVIEALGLADESYGLGPCWEMDYNVRAARLGWRGVWACASYVYRSPFTRRRQTEEARLFEASKHRYQDKFCGA